MTNYNRPQLLRRLKVVLSRHTGRDNPISMTALIPAVTGDTVIPNRRYNQSRIIRSLVQQLRKQGMPIVHRAGKGGGYYLATDDSELETSAQWFRARAMSSLRQEALLRRMSVSDLVKQYPLFEEKANHANS